MQNQNDLEDFQARAALHALGALLPFEERAFADELALASEETRAEVAELKAIASQLGLSVAEESPSKELRDRLLARIAREPQTPSVPASVAHLDVFAHEGYWTPLFDGGSCKVLFTEPTNGYVTSLLKLEPGKWLPNHHHQGNEQCLIVAGEFAMNGKVYRPGDFTVALAGSDHVGIYTETGGMLLLVSPPDYKVLAG
jgi:anti-sigma factor ChrR (cupin superfamily)